MRITMPAPKWTEERGAALVKAVEAGTWKVTAARSVGVSARTVRNWLKQGLEEGASSQMAAWVDDYRKAEAVAEMRLLSVVHDAATIDRDTKAAQWLLERRFPGRWAQTSKTEVTGKGGAPLHPITAADIAAALASVTDKADK